MKRTLISALLLLSAFSSFAQAPRMMLGANEPVGTPQGIYPGRVAWTHAPGATVWQGQALHQDRPCV